MLKALKEDAASPIMTPEDQAAVLKIFGKNNLTLEERSWQSFKIIIEARLRQLPDSVANKVRETMREHIFTHLIDSQVNGAYDLDEKSIVIRVPLWLRQTVVQEYVRMHEKEHAIQHEMGLAQLGEDTYLRQRYRFLTDVRFLEEAGAMAAEYQYLKAIPSREKDALIRAIMDDADLLEPIKSRIKRTLENSSTMSVEEYLKAEWAAGRYSKEEIFWNLTYPVKYRTLVEKLKVAAPWLIGAGTSWVVYCDLILKRKVLQNTPVYTACFKFLMPVESTSAFAD